MITCKKGHQKVVKLLPWIIETLIRILETMLEKLSPKNQAKNPDFDTNDFFGQNMDFMNSV